MSAHARITDPSTSQAAAETVAPGLPNKQAEVLLTLAELERTNPHLAGATAHEIVTRLAYTGQAPPQNCVARRITDLVGKGLVADAGVERQGWSAQKQKVWALTPDGRARAEALR